MHLVVTRNATSNTATINKKKVNTIVQLEIDLVNETLNVTNKKNDGNSCSLISCECAKQSRGKNVICTG